MNNYTDADARRPIILYIIIAIALCAALIFGVWWAKNRADHYAQQQTEQVSQPQGEPVPEVASQEQSQTPGTQDSPGAQETPAATQPAVTATLSVPAAGAEQALPFIVSMGAVVFAALSYIRTRRSLQIWR